ncbi:MAG: hypothetical protein COT33_03050 [Candidatus Nealsonbacteria bacterium CG08_land_8_20_14_0_20_38_20]|uniref:Uncharacterized protein n=1 Tax=Candidatus Nealsonbacteria bacterium CG08_land_8_20_14_0_20_38_20 TaxID=1974705 RepID=A0A2H0YLB3_9BACT|nr:MAG: hypothetical protein COT33_03050 [Candidatus Nealsonbacteria bacterium CG08_land_8_20_14_0_20_38_20]
MVEELKESEKSEEEILEDIKEVVIYKLEMFSPDKRFSIGSHEKGFTRDELIEEVRKETEIGKKVIEVELTFLRALKDGTLLEEVLTSEE